jgi:hypothetical protein
MIVDFVSAAAKGTCDVEESMHCDIACYQMSVD